jgi:hypothetical protein
MHMTDGLKNTIGHLEATATTLQRRLQILEEQAARYGEQAVPTHIVLELQDNRRDLARTQAELHRMLKGGRCRAARSGAV